MSRGVVITVNLDELPEFPRTAVKAPRQPLEERAVMIERIHGALRLPAAFLLVPAAPRCLLEAAAHRDVGLTADLLPHAR